jgi:hypothetical protein
MKYFADAYAGAASINEGMLSIGCTCVVAELSHKDLSWQVEVLTCDKSKKAYFR